MTGILGGVTLIVVGVGIVVFGIMNSHLARTFEHSYPFFIAYTITSMGLIVFGIAWLIEAVGAGLRA